MVVVSSDDEDSTDIEPSNPPTRGSSFREVSSQFPSSNYMSSSISSGSSSSSFENPLKYSSATITDQKIGAYSRRTKPTQSKDKFRVFKDDFNSKSLPAVATYTTKVKPNDVALPTASIDRAQISKTVLQFARISFGVDLATQIIAHDYETQRILDDNKIAWGVQYELARGVAAGLWDWETTRTSVHKLKGTNAEVVFKVERIMKKQNISQPADVHIWYCFRGHSSNSDGLYVNFAGDNSILNKMLSLKTKVVV